MGRKSDQKKLRLLAETINTLEKRIDVLENKKNEQEHAVHGVTRYLPRLESILIFAITKPIMIMIKTFGAAFVLETMNHAINILSTSNLSQPSGQPCLLLSNGLEISPLPPMTSAHTMCEFKI